MLQQVAASCSAVTVVVVCRLFHSARSCKIGSAKCSNFKPKSVHLPRYWRMDWWLPGAIDADEHHVAVVSFFLAEDLQTTTAVSFRGIFQQVAAKCSGVTVVVCRLFHSARSCKIGSAKCSNFKPQSVHLPRYWPMDWWLPGAIDADKHHVAVVSFFPGRGPPDNYSGVIPRHFPAGCCQMQRSDSSCVPTVPQCKIGSAKCSNFKPHEFPVVTAQQLTVGLCRPPRPTGTKQGTSMSMVFLRQIKKS